MKLLCPKCRTQIPEKNINVGENVCVCPACNELFDLSAVTDQDIIQEAEKLLAHPPRGAWVKKEINQTTVGVSLFSWQSIFLIFFAPVYVGFTFIACTELIKAEAGIVSLLFPAAFAGASLWLLVHTLYSWFGKIEIVARGSGQTHLFIGVGRIGKKYNIDWKKVKKISEKLVRGYRYVKQEICIVAEKPIAIDTGGLNKTKSEFLLKVLKYYKYKAG